MLGSNHASRPVFNAVYQSMVEYEAHRSALPRGIEYVTCPGERYVPYARQLVTVQVPLRTSKGNARVFLTYVATQAILDKLGVKEIFPVSTLKYDMDNEDDSNEREAAKWSKLEASKENLDGIRASQLPCRCPVMWKA